MQPGAIVREAWELYKGHWRTFVPLALIVYIILGLITLVFALLLGWLGAIIGALASIVGTFWLPDGINEFARSLISNTVVVPFIACAWTLMYFALAQGRSAAPAGVPEAYSPPPPPPSDGPTYR